MRLLKIVREIGLPDSFIGAGAVRNLVWDSLHSYTKRTPLNDVDVIYFDSSDLSSEKDLEIWKKFREIEPNINWNVFNQARAHIKDPKRDAALSTEEGVAYWSETPTCIGVRLNSDDSFSICAPYGIQDLMNLIVRPIPEPRQNLELYNERVTQKNWGNIWPKLNILDSDKISE